MGLLYVVCIMNDHKKKDINESKSKANNCNGVGVHRARCCNCFVCLALHHVLNEGWVTSQRQRNDLNILFLFLFHWPADYVHKYR